MRHFLLIEFNGLEAWNEHYSPSKDAQAHTCWHSLPLEARFNQALLACSQEASASSWARDKSRPYRSLSTTWASYF